MSAKWEIRFRVSMFDQRKIYFDGTKQEMIAFVKSNKQILEAGKGARAKIDAENDGEEEVFETFGGELLSEAETLQYFEELAENCKGKKPAYQKNYNSAAEAIRDAKKKAK